MRAALSLFRYSYSGVIIVIYLCNVFRLQLRVAISVVVYLVILVVPRDIEPLFYDAARLGETLFGIFVALVVNKYFDIRYIKSKFENLMPEPVPPSRLYAYARIRTSAA